MAAVKRSELRGILILILVVLIIGGLLAVSTGKLETWFGITSGPRLHGKIVYVSGDPGSYELFAANPDGSDTKQLTTGGRVLAMPYVSPNGSRVVFVGWAENANQIYLSRGTGDQPEALTSVTGGKRLPQYSANGKRLAFISGGTVYAGDLNGDDLQPILPTPEETHENMMRRDALPAYTTFAWSPKGEGMAGVSNDPELGSVLVYLPRQGGKAQRSAMQDVGRMIITGLSWARTRNALAILASTGKGTLIAVIDFDTKGARVIFAARADNTRGISFSPDGTQIATTYGSKSDSAESGIKMIDIATGRTGILARGVFDDLHFSPDGDKLVAIDKLIGNPGDVVVIDAKSGKVTKITDNGKSFNPVWSPAAEK